MVSYFSGISAWIWPSPVPEKESPEIESKIEEAKPDEIEEAKPFEVKETKSPEIEKAKSRRPSKKRLDIELMWCFKGSFLCFYFIVGLISWAILWNCSGAAISRYLFSGPQLPETCESKSSDRKNLYYKGFLFDFYAFVSENNAPNFEPDTSPILTKQNLTYYNDDVQSNFTFSTIVSIPEGVRNNGSFYLHIYLTKNGSPVPRKNGSCTDQVYVIHRSRRLNFYWKPLESNDSERSYWIPNLSVDMVKLERDYEIPIYGEENKFIECDNLSGKYYPILYLNDRFNVANDCIPIDWPTESLPLNVTFRQISMTKFRNYLWQSDFEEYFRQPNRTGEQEFVRKKLVETDFARGILSDYFKSTFFVILLFKGGLFAWGVLLWAGLDRRPLKPSKAPKSRARHTYDQGHSYDQRHGSRESDDLASLFLCALCFGFVAVVLLFLFPFLVVCIFCLSSREYTCKWTLRFDDESFEEYKKRLAERSKESSGPNHRMIFLNLFVFALLPLLPLYRLFSTYHVAFSTEENINIFLLLALCNCICYLTSVYWNNGGLLFGVHQHPCSNRWFYGMYFIQFWTNFSIQLAFLSVILCNFHFAFSLPELLVFIVAWLLSDLVVLMHLHRRAIFMPIVVVANELDETSENLPLEIR